MFLSKKIIANLEKLSPNELIDLLTDLSPEAGLDKFCSFPKDIQKLILSEATAQKIALFIANYFKDVQKHKKAMLRYAYENLQTNKFVAVFLELSLTRQVEIANNLDSWTLQRAIICHLYDKERSGQSRCHQGCREVY